MPPPLLAHIKRLNPIMALEIALGTTLSILLADMAGLKYSAAAGIITLLTIQFTRRLTIRTTLVRMGSFALMLGLCAIALAPMGFSTLGFGLFVLLFVGISYLIGWERVMSSNAVLATHFLLEGNMSPSIILNELWLISLGSLVGVVVNLLIPYRRKPLSHYRDDVEEIMRYILRVMARRILGACEEDGTELPCTPALRIRENVHMRASFRSLEARLHAYQSAAQDEGDNRLQPYGDYPQAYFQMRSRQLSFLQRMWDNLERVNAGYEMNHLLSDFFSHTADTFGEHNNAQALLELHAQMLMAYSDTTLPRDRAEFENRALLYAVLTDIRSLLEVKRDFADTHAKPGHTSYW